MESLTVTLAKYLSRPTIVNARNNARNNVHSHCRAALRTPLRASRGKTTKSPSTSHWAPVARRWPQVASTSERQTTVWPRSANVMRILTWKLILGILVLVFAVSAARANSVVNGSFETSTVPTGSFTNFITDSTGITGWTVVGPEASIVSGRSASFGFTFPAENGIQWLDLTGDGTNSVEGVKQTFASTPGTMHSLSYFVGNQVSPGARGGRPAQWMYS